MSIRSLTAKLDKGEVIILDGATGTELEKRGAPMSGDTWCADVNATHGHILEDVHRSYIARGADIITANTFATSVLSFNAYGRDDDVLTLDRAAVAAAKRAAAGTGVAVAGSISTMRPVIKGTDRTDKSREWAEPEARALFLRKAENLKQAGVNLLMMEMMRDCDYSVIASKAALSTGLPVWIGVSLERQPDGRITGFGREDQNAAEVFKTLAALKPEVMAIMHTSVNIIPECLALLRKVWTGPVAIYPECGYFKSPSWQFVDIIAPADLASEARHWHSSGATIFGGCCGLGPDHVEALSKEFRA